MKNAYQLWTDKIKEDNAAFKKANKARRRVMVAKDVIKALEVKLFEASGMSGYVLIGSGYTAFEEADENKDVRDLFTQIGPNCDVCAKGAIFTCVVMRQDNISKATYDSIKWRGEPSVGSIMIKLSDALGDLFSQEQLDLIEAHYEVGRIGMIHNSPFEKYNNGKERLVAVMKNIVKHQGTFKPELEGR